MKITVDNCTETENIVCVHDSIVKSIQWLDEKNYMILNLDNKYLKKQLIFTFINVRYFTMNATEPWIIGSKEIYGMETSVETENAWLKMVCEEHTKAPASKQPIGNELIKAVFRFFSGNMFTVYCTEISYNEMPMSQVSDN